MPPKGKGKARGPKNQHKLCSSLPENELLCDLRKKPWRLGTSIGSGGFGLIYLADDGSKTIVKNDALYVIKIEPQDNGPLYCEIAFYQRAARPDQIEEWKNKVKLGFLGVPKYIAHGLHEREKENFRFLVMPRFGADLHNLWLKAEKRFKRSTVAKIAIQMIDALEYIHQKEYTHADIKGSNIICDWKNPNQVYLVDYGLASRYTINQEHKKYEADPKKAHNGTIEYTSSDAHLGANPSRRGDFQILGFVLLHWVAGTLPWEDNLKNADYVRDQKAKSMENVKRFVESLCPSDVPGELIEFLSQAAKLSYEEKPDYNKARNIFKNALKSFGENVNKPVDFSSAVAQSNFRKTPKKVSRPNAQKKSVAPRSSPLRSKTNNPSNRKRSSGETDLSESEQPVRTKKGRTGKAKTAGKNSISSSCSEVEATAKQGRRRAPRKREHVVYVDDSSADEGREVSSAESDCESMPSPSGGTKLPKSARHATKRGTRSGRKNEAGSDVTPVKKTPMRKRPSRKASQEESSTSEDKIEVISPDHPSPKKQARGGKSSSKSAIKRQKLTEVRQKDTSVAQSSGRKKRQLPEYMKETNRPGKTPSPKHSRSKSQSTTSKTSESESSIVDVPSETEENENSADKEQSPRKTARSSRHSMAPLHTKSVLTKNDKLTGAFSGKHPVFIRKRKVNVCKENASTQTTPSLRRNVPKT